MKPPVIIPGFLTPAACAALREAIDAGDLENVQGRIPRTDVLLPWRYTLASAPRAAELITELIWMVCPRLEEEFGSVVELDPISPRFHVYHAGDHVGVHTDRNPASPRVRISISLLIACEGDADDSLVLYHKVLGQAPIMEPGTLIAFDGATPHEVVPVPGDRYAVVAWLLEP